MFMIHMVNPVLVTEKHLGEKAKNKASECRNSYKTGIPDTGHDIDRTIKNLSDKAQRYR